MVSNSNSEAMQATWRAINGHWAVYGPADLGAPGQYVTVTRKDGTTSQVLIGNVQPAKRLNGRPFVYGWPQRKKQAPVRSS